MAARRRTYQSRRRDAVACGGDRGKYRARQHGRGRRHANRTRRQDTYRGAHPRYRGQGSRPCHRRQRPEGRGKIIRQRAPDGAAACREPQSGRCRTGGTDHAGWPGDGLRRRYHQTARYRRCLEEGSGAGADIPAGCAGACTWRGCREHAERTARRPRLARQSQSHRSRRPEPQRDRSEERQSRRRRSAARQQMDLRQYQPQSPPAKQRRGGAEPRRGGRPPVVAAGGGRSAEQWRAIARPARRQSAGRKYPAGDAGEGPHLQRRLAAVR